MAEQGKNNPLSFSEAFEKFRTLTSYKHRVTSKMVNGNFLQRAGAFGLILLLIVIYTILFIIFWIIK